MRLIRESRLHKMLKEAYEKGLNIRDEIDAQTKRMEKRNRGIILSGYDINREVEEILRRKGGS